MSLFKKNTVASALQDKISNIKATLQAQGGSLADPVTAGNAFALESADSTVAGNVTTTVEQITGELGQHLETTDTFALEACASVVLAGANPSAFYAASASFKPSADQQLVGDSSFAVEGYQDRDFSKYVAHSVAFTQETVKASNFGEAFFPTQLISAETPVLVSELSSTVVTKDVRHKLTGEVTDTQDRNLAHAITDPGLLDGESTRVYPSVAADDSNLAYFVDAALYPAKEIDVDGVTVKTAPMKIGKDLNILGLASNAANLDGQVLDLTDVLDSAVLLNTVVLKVTNLGADKAEGGGDDTVSIIEVPVSNLPRASFLKSIEGSSNELELRFKNRGFALSSATKDITGTDAAALQYLSDEKLTVNLELFGTVDMRTSNMRVSAAGTEVDRIIDGDVDIPKSSAAGVTILEVLDIEVIGYTIDAVRTNANRRSIGHSVDTRSNSVVWNIGSQSPFYSRVPTTAEEDGAKVGSLIEASRVRTANNAVTTLLAHVNAVASFYADGKGVPVSEVFKGAADEVLPYHKAIPLDVKAKINSISTHEKAEDLRGLLSDVLTHEIALMAQESNYITALEMASHGNEDLRVVIGTDPIIARLLMTSGDERTFGEGVKYEIVSTTDRRMKGKIIVSFQRENAKGFGPLSFGARAYIPELIGTTQVTRGGSTSNELIVQPRELHQATLPVVLEVDITNLTELLSDKT